MSKLSYTKKRRIIKKYQNNLPVRIISIAHEMGIRVFKVEYNTDDISGNIVYDEEYGGDSGYAIYVNKKHSDVRRRFTTAHEIAHYVLHEDSIGDGIVDDALYRSGLSNKLEVEANTFAANILMPLSLLTKQLEEGIFDINKLSEKFKVSSQAMSIKLGVPQ